MKSNAFRNLLNQTLAFITFCVAISNQSYGSAYLKLDKKAFYPKDSIQYYVDSSGERSLEEIKKIQFDKNFQDFLHSDLPLDSIQDPIWFRFKIMNKTGIAQEFSVSNDNTLMRQQSIHSVGTNRKTLKSNSTLISKAQKTSIKDILTYLIKNVRQDRLLTLTDTLKPNQTKWIYVKLQSEFPKEPRFLVSFQKGYWNFELTRQSLFAIYFGAVGAILLINLLVFLRLRRRAYLYYVFFGSSMALNAFVGIGAAEQYLGSVLSVPDFARLSLALPILTGVAFSREFLQTKNHKSLTDRLLSCIYWLVLLSLPLRFTDMVGDHLMTMTDIFSVIFFVLIIQAGLKAKKEQHKAAVFFILSFSILFVAASIFLLQRHDFITRNFFTQNVVLIAQIFELLILSAALTEDYKQLEKKKATAEAMANESLELRTLVRVLSHDIVNPVAIIKGHADIQMQIIKDENSKKSWQRVQVACKSILDLVHSVRDMRSLKEGKLKVNIEPVLIKDLIEHIRFTFTPRVKEKHLALNIETNSLETKKLKGNASIIKNQILNNILSNAIKFSSEGGKLDLYLEEKNGNIDIILRDYGIGIPESILIDIFDPTAQTSRAGTQGEKGTGYGMPIVKSFIERFGGSIRIDSWTEEASEEECGTRIVVSIPEWKSSRKDKDKFDDLEDAS